MDGLLAAENVSMLSPVKSSVLGRNLNITVRNCQNLLTADGFLKMQIV